MTQHPIETDLKAALAAVRHARDVRGYHRRRTQKGSMQREADLAEARERLSKAMVPLRSYQGKGVYREQSHTLEALTERVQQASRELQSERRKIWKMQSRNKDQEIAD